MQEFKKYAFRNNQNSYLYISKFLDINHIGKKKISKSSIENWVDKQSELFRFWNLLTLGLAWLSSYITTFLFVKIDSPFRVAAAQCKNICPDWPNWLGSLAAISEGAR